VEDTAYTVRMCCNVDDNIPSCDCPDWHRHYMPFKHLLAVINTRTPHGCNSLPEATFHSFVWIQKLLLRQLLLLQKCQFHLQSPRLQHWMLFNAWLLRNPLQRHVTYRQLQTCSGRFTSLPDGMEERPDLFVDVRTRELVWYCRRQLADLRHLPCRRSHWRRHHHQHCRRRDRVLRRHQQQRPE